MLQRISCILSLCVSFIIPAQNGYAQQDPVFGQYIFNSTVINPAQAGVFDQSQWGVVYRNQWLGIEGAPVTKSFFANFKANKSIGSAFSVYQDVIGPINDVTIQADLAYPIRLNDSWTLSGGIRGNASRITANLANLKHVQSGDPNFDENLASGIFFNVGMGLLLYNHRVFVGISMPKMIGRELAGQQVMNIKLKQHYFTYGGIQLEISDSWLFAPSFLAKMTSGAPVQIDLNALFKYNNTFDFGPVLRSRDALGILLGFHMTEKWYLGYQFEYPLTDIQQVTRQTHEFALRFLWDSRYKARIRSPRYFI